MSRWGAGALIRCRRYQLACATPAARQAALVPIRGASRAIASSVTSSTRARCPCSRRSSPERLIECDGPVAALARRLSRIRAGAKNPGYRGGAGDDGPARPEKKDELPGDSASSEHAQSEQLFTCRHSTGES